MKSSSYICSVITAYTQQQCFAEYKFHDTRKWRFDFAIPDKKIAIEVEGGVWIQGRHNRASGFIKDMEKYNAAAALGWLLIRATPQNIVSTEILTCIRSAIKCRENVL